MREAVQQASGSTAQVQEIPERLQSTNRERMAGRTAELENSLGVSRVRSVETHPEGHAQRRAAKARLIPHEYVELEKGAQENATQRPDACSAQPLSP